MDRRRQTFTQLLDTMSDFSNPYIQAEMILDKKRTDPFFFALSQIITKKDIVLDLGSGSGILSFLSAKFGAKKVYAIESTNAVDFILPIAIKNRVSKKIEIIKGDILKYNWGKIIQPTIIVSETIGNFAPGENIHNLIQSVVNYFPNPIQIIPRSYKLSCSLVNSNKINKIRDNLSFCYDLNFEPLVMKAFETPTYTFISKNEVLSDEQLGAEISLLYDFPKEHIFSLKINTNGFFSAICLGFDLEVAKGINILNSPLSYMTSWSHLILPLKKITKCYKGQLFTCKLYFPDVTNKKTWKWSLISK